MIKIIQVRDEFPCGYFNDWNAKLCEISLSSLADDRCILLGRVDVEDDRKSMMLLNVEQVKELIPVLQRFVKTGDINPCIGIDT